MRRRRKNINKEKIKGESLQGQFLQDSNLILYSVFLLIAFVGLSVAFALYDEQMSISLFGYDYELPGFYRLIFSSVLLILTAFSTLYLGQVLNVVQRRNTSPFFFVILLSATNPYFLSRPIMALGAFCGSLLLWWVFRFAGSRNRNEYYFWTAFILSVIGLLDKQLFLLSLFFLIFSFFVVKSTFRELLSLLLGLFLPIYGYYSIAFLAFGRSFSIEEYRLAYEIIPNFDHLFESQGLQIHLLGLLLLMVNALYVYRKRSSFETQAYREQSGFLTIYALIIVLAALFMVRTNLFLLGMLYQAGALVVSLFFITRSTIWSKILFLFCFLFFVGLGVYLYFQSNVSLIMYR